MAVPARIVFDLDGTLIDSAPDIQGISNRLLADRGLKALTIEETKRFIGNGAGVYVQRMRAARAIPDKHQDTLLAAFIAAYDTAMNLTHPYPGVTEALGALKQAGHALGICTNKPAHPAEMILRHLNLRQFFDTVLGGDSLAVRKPDPAPLHAAFDALGDGAMIYVGDSEVDAATAQAADVPFLLFTPGYRKTPVAEILHHSAFDAFSDLAAVIDNLAGTSTDA